MVDMKYTRVKVIVIDEDDRKYEFGQEMGTEVLMDSIKPDVIRTTIHVIADQILRRMKEEKEVIELPCIDPRHNCKPSDTKDNGGEPAEE